MGRKLVRHDSRGDGRRSPVFACARDAEIPNHDYWLFDSRKSVRMHFGNDDRFLGGEIIEDAAEIVRHNYWRDVARHHAVRRDDCDTEQG